MRKVFELLERNSNWRLERGPHDLRTLTHQQQQQVIDRLAGRSADHLESMLNDIEKELKTNFRRGGRVDQVRLSNMNIMRDAITQAINKKKFGEGWSAPEGSLPEGDLAEVDLPRDLARVIDPGSEQSVWEKYGIKQTPGWAPPSWAVEKKDLNER